MRQHAHVLEVGEVVADGGGGHAEVEALAEVLGPDRSAERDVLLDDGPQDLLLPSRERQPTPLNAESETGARTPRRPRASPFASRGLYHCAGKPIQRRRGCAATSRSRTAATSASGTRSPQRAASRRRSRARVSRVERLERARRRRAGGQRRRPGGRVGRVGPAPGADGAHGAGAEAEVRAGAPVRHVVARPAPRQGEVADLVPVVAGARELPHDAPVAGRADVVHGVAGMAAGSMARVTARRPPPAAPPAPSPRSRRARTRRRGPGAARARRRCRRRAAPASGRGCRG